MKFGVGVDYCLKALIMLAERYPDGHPQRVEEIAEAQGIPENYLRRLLIELKRGGLVKAKKGRAAAICWRASPHEITMVDVVHIIEGDYVPVECLEEHAAGALCRPGDGCTMREVWREVRDSVNAILARTTLQALDRAAQDRARISHLISR